MPTFPLNRTEVHTSGGAIMAQHVTNGTVRLPVDRTTPLAYIANHATLNRSVLIGSGYASYGLQNWAYSSQVESAVNPGVNPKMTEAYNKAYARLVEQLGTKAALGSFLAEGNSALQMVATRAMQLHDAYKALKRGRFREFLGVLDARPLKHHRDVKWSKPKDASSLWLEYWMGWAPSIGDMFNAAEVLSSTPPSGFIEASATAPWHAETLSTWPDPVDYQFYQKHSLDAKCRVKMGAWVTITSPNLFLANRLGLANPASTLLEITPFSWLVGWLVNLEQVIAHLTDFAGVQVQSAYITRSVSYSGEMEFIYRRKPWFEQSKCAPAGVYMRRTVGAIDAPILHVKMLDRLSLTRGLTAMSLLTTLFAPKH